MKRNKSGRGRGKQQWRELNGEERRVEFEEILRRTRQMEYPLAMRRMALFAYSIVGRAGVSEGANRSPEQT